ncbi:MAG: WD40 repeat domain-containing protein [Candidatus Eremiobacterota bacterium]
MNKPFICVIFFIFLLSLPVFADSPLTSTEFYNAYMDIEQVKNAKGATLNEDIFNFITDPYEPLDVRIAVINAMGWNINGTDNGRIFIDLMARKLNKVPGKIKISDLSSEEILCLGYMLSMDDYFTLSPSSETGGEVETSAPMTLVKKAALQKPDNFTIQLIASLVKAQSLLSSESEWGNIYLTVNRVVSSDLEKNMRKEAIGIIMDYIGSYKEYVDKDKIKESAIVIKAFKETKGKTGLGKIELSPDGTRLVTTGGDEKAVRIWNVKTGDEINVLNTADFIDCAIFSSDGKWIIVSDFTPGVSIYSSRDYSLFKTLQIPSRVLAMAVNPSNPEIAFACFDGKVQLYSTVTWEHIKSLNAHSEYVSTVCYSSDSKYLLTGSYDRTVKLWDIRQKYYLEHEYKDFREGTFAYFMKGNKEILVRDFAGYIKILDISSGKVTWENKLTGTLHGVSADPEGNLIAAASETGTIYFWNRKTNTDPLIFRAHDDQVISVKFSSSGRELYSCSLDKTWKIWTVRILENRLKDICGPK